MLRTFFFSCLLTLLALPGLAQHDHAADLVVMCQEWELVETRNQADLVLPKTNSALMRYAFRQDGTMTVTRKGVEVDGRYKVDLHGGDLRIIDAENNREFRFVIKALTQQELVLFYPDEINGFKTLVFAPYSK